LRTRRLIEGADLSGERSICRAILVLSFLLVWNGCCKPSGIPRKNFENRKRVSRTSHVDSIIRVSSSLELRYSCCFERSPCLSNHCALHDNVRESAAKKKLPKRDLKTSRHLRLSILLIDYRYLSIMLTLVPIIIEDIPSAIVPVVENCRV